MTSALIKRRNLDTEVSVEGTQRSWEETKNEAMDKPCREGLGQILPSQPSEGTDPTNTLILDF